MSDRPRYQQFKRPEEPVEDVWDLLFYMISTQWNVSHGVINLPGKRGGKYTRPIRVERSYDHNYSFSSDYRELPEEIFLEARAAGYLKGKPEWGYTSDRKWIVSELGERALWDKVRVDREAREAEEKRQRDEAELKQLEERDVDDDLEKLW